MEECYAQQKKWTKKRHGPVVVPTRNNGIPNAKIRRPILKMSLPYYIIAFPMDRSQNAFFWARPKTGKSAFFFLVRLQNRLTK